MTEQLAVAHIPQVDDPWWLTADFELSQVNGWQRLVAQDGDLHVLRIRGRDDPACSTCPDSTATP